MNQTERRAGGLPPHVRAEVRRILDRAARRLLAEQVDLDSLGTAAGVDVGTLYDGADQGAPLGELRLR
jgi:hypothetical protein